jgi:DNA-binding MarR family transcriptional regulator
MADMPDDPTPSTVHHLRALVLVLEQHGREFATQNGLSGSDIRALVELLDHERAGTPASPTMLARALGLTTASTTSLLDRLQRAGHVRRVARTDDRRRVNIVVTDSATRIGWQFFGPLIAATQTVLDARTPPERTVIDEFLVELTASLRSIAAPEDPRRSAPDESRSPAQSDGSASSS